MGAIVELVGHQEPRILSVPAAISSLGQEAIELAASTGLDLDPWQQLVLNGSLGQREDGKWAAFEVGVEVPRQNGKGGIIEARELASLFLEQLPERLAIHSAHQFDTSLEAFRRLLYLVEDTPDLDRQVKRVSRSHGEEGIELKNGRRIRFRTRTKGGGRGFTGDLLILDEAMSIPLMAHGALLPTLSARPNPQVWYLGSAVDQDVHDDGIVFARIRERGRAGDDPSLAYFEWSVDCEKPDEVTPEQAVDLEEWARANPALGIRISAEHISYEQRSMDPRTFAVERLGVGDWPRTDGESSLIDPQVWDNLTDEGSATDGPFGWSFDVTPDRSAGAIGVAGPRQDRLSHLEVVEHRRGTGWVVDRLVDLVQKHGGVVAADGAGPAGALLMELEQRGVAVQTVNAREHAQACGQLVDAVENSTIRHLGTRELKAAVRGAAQRPLGDAWAWSRKSSSVDISPLVACTLALWAAAGSGTSGGFEW